MEEFLPFRHLVIPWKNRRAWLRDEAQLEYVKERSNERWERVTADVMALI